MRSLLRASLVGCTLAASLACWRSDPVIARVGDWELTPEGFEREIAVRAQDEGQQYDSAEARAALLAALVERKVLAAAAREAGYEDHPLAAERYEQWLGAQYAEDELEKRLAAIDVDAAAVEHAYAAKRDELGTPERVHLAVLLIEVPTYAKPDARAAARDRAERARAEAVALAQHADLGSVAVSYSDDRATRYLGGDAGWVERTGSRLPSELIDAAFAAADGELTPVVESPKGFAFAKRIAHEPATVPTLEQVGPGIRRALLDERRHAARNAFLAEARESVDVEIHVDRVGGKALPVLPEPAPPPVPGG